jgi:hypothetical protein
MLKRLLFAVLLLCACAAQAAVYSLPWGPKPQFVDANGAPMSNGTLTFYASGSLTYKLILKDSAGATVWTIDNIAGVNDVSVSLDEWKASAITPTYVSATSFTMAGDQTVEFHKGRRLKSTNSGGTIYSTITASAFAAVTTVTVANDSGVLDAGLSAISLSVVRANNPSIAPDMVHRKGAAVTAAGTTDIWSIVGDYVHVTGTTTITSFSTAPYAGAQRTLIFDGALTLTHNATTLVLPGGVNITTAANDRAIVRADTTANMIVVSYIPAAGTGDFRTVQTFTANGTYTTPAGLRRAEVWLCSAGGAGGGSAATGAGQVSGGAGGGAGGNALRLLTAAQIGASQTVTVAAAAAGASGAAGANGTSTSFGALLSATGGTGGGVAGPAASITVAGAAGGAGSSGDINGNGMPGGMTNVTQTVAGLIAGNGGSSLYGGGGIGPSSLGPSGGAASGFCAGGSGTTEGASGAANTGGASTGGLVIVREFYFKAVNDDLWLDRIGTDSANDSAYRKLANW